MLWSIDSCQNWVSADQYHLTVSRAWVPTHRGWLFFEVIRWQVTSFQMTAGSSLIFFKKFIWNMLCLCAAQLKCWFQTDLGRENSASYYRQGRQLLLTLLAMITRWSRSSSNFYAVIGQNVTGEFMWKIYAASWILFTLTAEADRVLCQLVMFLTVFFHWMYKMKYSCYQESSVIHGWFVYWVFGWEMRRLSKLGNPISDGIVFVFHLAQCVRGFKSLKQLWPSLTSFRNWISNGKPE